MSGLWSHATQPHTAPHTSCHAHTTPTAPATNTSQPSSLTPSQAPAILTPTSIGAVKAAPVPPHASTRALHEGLHYSFCCQ
mmetsp:Transcript_136889/g.237872  ORF Transcript_136889/g.237872 Transcript_136889/m.237872 type:complete len:81 (+) Transcript_136889:132-374(+)